MDGAAMGKSRWAIYALTLALAMTSCSQPEDSAESSAQSLTQEPILIKGCASEFRPVADQVSAIIDEVRFARRRGCSLCKMARHAVRLFFGNYDENTTVHLVSAAKWLSAATIMTLVDDGTLSLDEPISSTLPYYAGDREATTIRQLLSHTAGLPIYHDCMFESSSTLDACARQIAVMLLMPLPAQNFATVVRAIRSPERVAEAASDKAWLLIFEQKMAAPLGLTHTHYGPTRNHILSEGYVVSTLDEYGIFLQMLLDGGVAKSGEQILSPEAIAELHGDQTSNVEITFSPGGPDTSYGLGVWRSGFDGQWCCPTSRQSRWWADLHHGSILNETSTASS